MPRTSRDPSLLRSSEPRSAARVLHLLPGIGPASAQRVLDCMAEAENPTDALISMPTPAARRRRGEFAGTIARAAHVELARRYRTSPAVV